MKKRGKYSYLISISLLLLFLPACKTKADFSSAPGSIGFSYYGVVGNIYQFIFGSDTLGKYGHDYTGFNFWLFLGFMFIIASIIISIVILKKDEDFKLMLAQTIVSGLAMFFLSPIFTATAVFGFYDSLPELDKTGSFPDYAEFRYGYGCVLLFLFLIIIFIYNLYSTLQLKKEAIR